MELIKVKNQNGEKAVNARELHQFLGSKQQFSDWIKSRIRDYGFVEGQDFVCISENYETQRKNGQRGISIKTDYIISLDMAKELSMVERNEKGKMARRYFIEIEKKAKEYMLSVPQPKKYNGVPCIHYTSWLIKNGYSLMSGQVRAGIKKYPTQFRQGKDGWYMSQAIAEYFESFKFGKQKLQELPSVNPKQMQLFN